MMFVDGENLTLRAQQTARDSGLALEPGPHYRADTFIWFRGKGPSPLGQAVGLRLQDSSIRSYYYASVVGSEDDREQVREALWRLHFDPQVFRKDKKGRSKGVDISLTRDMLLHAFRDHYDVAVLVSGDGDYEPVVQEVKHLGKVVHIAAFDSGLNNRLKLAGDRYIRLNTLVGTLPSVKEEVAPSPPVDSSLRPAHPLPLNLDKPTEES